MISSEESADGDLVEDHGEFKKKTLVAIVPHCFIWLDNFVCTKLGFSESKTKVIRCLPDKPFPSFDHLDVVSLLFSKPPVI